MIAEYGLSIALILVIVSAGLLTWFIIAKDRRERQ